MTLSFEGTEVNRKMEILETVGQWLTGFPRWGEAGLTLDCVSCDPENGALLPKGFELLSSTEDVLGNRALRLRCTFRLQRVGFDPDGTDAALVLALQQWVYDQCAAGSAPKLGENTRWRAEKGQLATDLGAGTGVYTVQLIAEFTKRYDA